MRERAGLCYEEAKGNATRTPAPPPALAARHSPAPPCGPTDSGASCRPQGPKRLPGSPVLRVASDEGRAGSHVRPTGVGVARLGWGGAGLTPRLTAPPLAAPRLPPPRTPRAEARCHPWARHREATAKPLRGAACAGRVSTAPRAGARAVVTVTTGPVAPVMRSRKSGGDPPRARPGAWGPVLRGASGAGSLG